jgi:hypothetical protein
MPSQLGEQLQLLIVLTQSKPMYQEQAALMSDAGITWAPEVTAKVTLDFQGAARGRRLEDDNQRWLS